MKRVIASLASGLGMLILLSSSANASGEGCCIIKPCKKGGYAYVKKYHKVAVKCYKKKYYKVATKCIETASCEPMTCYKTKVKMVPSTCYKTEAYMERVWVDARDNIRR